MEDQGGPVTEPRPPLAFGAPSIGPIPAGTPSYKPPPRGPSAGRQGVRLTPQFKVLQDALSGQRIEAAAEATETDPELVVVFDIAGSVERFSQAVSRIDGLAFLAEIEDEDAAADDDFFVADEDGNRTARAVPETLYLVLSNVEAVAQLVRLFELWQADPDQPFDRGLAPLKNAFSLLRAIRRWGPLDRVRETGLMEQWTEDVEVAGGQGFARVEIELWFRSDIEVRRLAQLRVERLVLAAGGAVVTTATLLQVGYHAVLADIPYDQVQAVLDEGPEAIELLTAGAVMLVTPSRPMHVSAGPTALDSARGVDDTPAPGTLPRIALLDGLPLANHDVLAGRLVIDDPDDIARTYTSPGQAHGTAMASLLCHGDLSLQGPALTSPVYVRPILQPDHFGGEVVQRDRLFADVLHGTFVRMFEGAADRPPSAPSVRVVSLSVGDPARVFTRRVSPVARLLDWLAHRYNVLVLVSAGNHVPEIPLNSRELLAPSAVQQAVGKAAFDDARRRRLLSPAEAVNVITVGALHADGASGPASDTVLDVVAQGHPALYSAVGSGHSRAVKPDILLPGGRQLLLRPPPGEGAVTLTPAPQAAVGPGLLHAAPDPRGGSGGIAYSCGTSNATALASRMAHQILDVLTALDPPDDEPPFPDAQYHPVLAKALLVHAAAWSDVDGALRQSLDLSGQTAKRDLTQMLGYGAVDPLRAATAQRTRSLLLGAGSIAEGERQRLLLPLPAALDRTTEWRRLTVTLAWLSPVDASSFVYRMARLRCHVDEGKLGLVRKEVDGNASRRGTVQHEIFEATRAVVLAPGDMLTLDVDCRVDRGTLASPVRFGVAASLEVAETVQADIHAQVRAGLRAQVRQRVSGRG